MTTQSKLNKIEEVRAKLQAQAERVAQMESQAVRGGRRPASGPAARRAPVNRRRIANSFLIAILLILIGGTGGILYSTYTTYLDTQSIQLAAEQMPSHLRLANVKSEEFGSLLRAAMKKHGISESVTIAKVDGAASHEASHETPAEHAAVASDSPVAEEHAAIESAPAEPAPVEPAHVEEVPAPQVESPAEVVEAPEPAPAPETPAESAPEVQPEPTPAPEAPAAEPQPEPAPEPQPETPVEEAPAPEPPAEQPAPEQPAPAEPPAESPEPPRGLPFAP